MDLSSPSVYYCSTVHFLVLMFCKRNIEINLPVASRDKGGGRVRRWGCLCNAGRNNGYRVSNKRVVKLLKIIKDYHFLAESQRTFLKQFK